MTHTQSPPPSLDPRTEIAFIGGGNMARALLSGLITQGHATDGVQVVEPLAETAHALRADFPDLTVHEGASTHLSRADVVVWAVKPQQFVHASALYRDWTAQTLHVSIMAGVRNATLQTLLRTDQTVRTMPNTPALIGLGITGLYADTSHVHTSQRHLTEALLSSTGQTLWVDTEDDLDAVTALSGSGPAYVFYFLEAMQKAAAQMGLTAQQGRVLGQATFIGAASLAANSSDDLAVLRDRVTSKGGTTAAALNCLQDHAVGDSFVQAMLAAQARAKELGRA
jgi:pyrroline-5-carboxylate reductase